MTSMNMTKRLMPIIIMVYMGMTLIILPRYLYIDDVFREMISSTGLVLMISGVVWFFYARLERRLDKAFELFAGPLSTEINEIKMVRGEELSKLFRSYYGMSEVKVIIDVRSIGRWSHEFIDNLAFKLNSGRTKLLITGHKVCDTEGSATPEYEFFFHQLAKIQHDFGDRINIKVCAESTNNTIIFGRYNITLIVPFDLKGKFLLYVDAKSNSDFLENYQRHFEELWQNSSNYNE